MEVGQALGTELHVQSHGKKPSGRLYLTLWSGYIPNVVRFKHERWNELLCMNEMPSVAVCTNCSCLSSLNFPFLCTYLAITGLAFSIPDIDFKDSETMFATVSKRPTVPIVLTKTDRAAHTYSLEHLHIIRGSLEQRRHATSHNTRDRNPSLQQAICERSSQDSGTNP